MERLLVTCAVMIGSFVGLVSPAHGDEFSLFIMDELSGDCAFGLPLLYRDGAEPPRALLVSYGTSPLGVSVRNTQDLYALLGDRQTRLYRGASGPLEQPHFMTSIPRFYGPDGKVGVDFRGLVHNRAARRRVHDDTAGFFRLLTQEAQRRRVILCVLGPWTDVAYQLRHNKHAMRALANVSAVITVAGAFALDSSGKSLGNEGAEHQAEYNVYLDPIALVEGVQFFNDRQVPVYDISWAFKGRWRLWRALLETLQPQDTDDGLAWSGLLLAQGFYTFHRGNPIAEGTGVGERAWFTADAHALLFAKALQHYLMHASSPDRCVILPWAEARFALTPIEFQVVVDTSDPAHYGRTIRIEDIDRVDLPDLDLSDPLLVQEVSLAGEEQQVLAHVLRALGHKIDERRWREILERYGAQ